jgi:ankyrin repeat protein
MSQELFDAIKAGDAARVSAVLDGDPSLVDAVNAQGISAYAAAVYQRQPAIAELLEQRGAKFDVYLAAMAGKFELVNDLVANNKSLATKHSGDGWTALHLACFFGHKEVAQALLNQGAEVNAVTENAMKNQPLHAAAAGRRADIVALLLERGANVNAKQHGGWTALHAAAQNGDLEMIQTLLANGADTNLRADNNQTPLDLALTRGNQAAVEALEAGGARL